MQNEKLTQVIYVNGYGAPDNPITDGNYQKYLRPILDTISSITSNGDTEIHLYLAGGNTNNPYRSEADAMREWFIHYGLPESVSIILLDETTSLIENIRAFEKRPVGGYSTRLPIIFYCKYPNHFSVSYLAGYFFRYRKIVPIKFDKRTSGFREIFKQLLWKLPLNILSLYFPLIDQHVRLPIRERHIRKARQKRQDR